MVPESAIWVFNGDGGQFPGGVFSSQDRAVAWIEEHALSGVLTAYPLDEGCLDWAVRVGVFKVTTPRHEERLRDPRFRSAFSSASQEHWHFVDGVRR